MEEISCEAQKVIYQLYKVVDLKGKEIFEGTDKEVMKRLDMRTHVSSYAKKKSVVGGKYRIVKSGTGERPCTRKPYKKEQRPKPETEKLTEYQQLLRRQIQLLREYDSVVGHKRNIEKNIRDLEAAGFKVRKREAVIRSGKGRKARYWILEKMK